MDIKKIYITYTSLTVLNEILYFHDRLCTIDSHIIISDIFPNNCCTYKILLKYLKNKKYKTRVI